MHGRTDSLKAEPLKKRLWFSLPAVFTLLVLFVSLIPVSFTGYAGVRPCLIYIPVFYWAVFRPYSFSVRAAFLFGLILDYTNNEPLGINVLILLLFYLTVQSQRRFLMTKSFVSVWAGFSFLCFAVYCVKWFLTAVYYARFPYFLPVFFSWVLLVFLYPPIAGLCARTHFFLTEKEND